MSCLLQRPCSACARGAGGHRRAVALSQCLGTVVTWARVSPVQGTFMCLVSSVTQQSSSGEAAVLRSTFANASGAYYLWSSSLNSG